MSIEDRVMILGKVIFDTPMSGFRSNRQRDSIFFKITRVLQFFQRSFFHGKTVDLRSKLANSSRKLSCLSNECRLKIV